MTAEQLEELLYCLEHTQSEYWTTSTDEALRLARNVIAAEKLVAELELILENDDDHWSMFNCALTAYREASK